MIRRGGGSRRGLAARAAAPCGPAPGRGADPAGGELALRARSCRRGALAGWGERRRLSGALTLAGALQAQGHGDEVTVDTAWTGQIVDRSFFTRRATRRTVSPGRVKVPFWLQPDRHYVGPAWYQRELAIPAEWRGRRVLLHLERPHWQTIAWLDGRVVGSRDSLSTRTSTSWARASRPARTCSPSASTTACVVDVGLNSHSVSDHTQGNWNGIVGALELRSTGAGVDRGPAGLPGAALAQRASCAGGSASSGGRAAGGHAAPRRGAAGRRRARGRGERRGAGSRRRGRSRCACRSARRRPRGTSSRPRCTG